MDYSCYRSAALFENQFWYQILGDHARFILSELSPKETIMIDRAYYFIDVFDDLLQEARKDLTEKEVLELSHRGYSHVQDLRLYKLEIIKKQLTNDISIGLPPTFINHMVNEVEHYMMILGYLLSKQIPVTTAIYEHLVWLLDAGGHASAIDASLDDVEVRFKEISRGFHGRFQDLYIKAVEMCGFMRSSLTNFPAFERFNSDVAYEINLFKEYIRDLEKLELEEQLLGTLSPLILDHMAREEWYYLKKVSMVTEVMEPAGDPTKPRTE
ncbi:DUF2935 domain-containing protein [Alkaliphilus hydrothermalis]|uniref:DUF2935 domain-containing protein n=1 Tax=Alkaliphilus hydrothermalis TaxID=1482730 RepID=A0ABS2NTM0_9FIRM|nr:DUF2935 domain-containing protein [Alkaliphilus hydrothermalis]MBM7616276.1 hypothetical protein [Alkaliphilus hydrothermalis]